VTLTRSLGASVIAEGVSSGELAYACRSLGCNWAQGHYFAAAASPEEIEALLRSQGQLQLVA
jgi:EAL domain-containing protein (putative c-di-GMP-specific phosphodiesterase class I)